MLDELFEIFERDNDEGGRRRHGPREGGVRGFFSRMFGGGDAGREDHSAPHRDRRDPHDDDVDDHDARRSRRRDRDFFEFGDD